MKIAFNDHDEKAKIFHAVNTTAAKVVVVVILKINLSNSCEVFSMKVADFVCEEQNIFEYYYYHSLTIQYHPM